jgi:hypothetical protein
MATLTVNGANLEVRLVELELSKLQLDPEIMWPSKICSVQLKTVEQIKY